MASLLGTTGILLAAAFNSARDAIFPCPLISLALAALILIGDCLVFGRIRVK